ncbi:lasso peptide biosynthesis B2 protein [Gammaproteobacteria bacterium]|nr:lasso peptide biosynthesis B2 protein [Gammaproteobacteria bacterium]
MMRTIWKAWRLIAWVRRSLRRTGTAATIRGLEAKTMSHPALSASQLATAVNRAARLYPGTTCLPHALVLAHLLQSAGIDHRFRIGVQRDGTRLAAHAWVEQGGKVLGPPGEVGAFTPFDGDPRHLPFK